jgi:hypothetical protein
MPAKRNETIPPGLKFDPGFIAGLGEAAAAHPAIVVQMRAWPEDYRHEFINIVKWGYQKHGIDPVISFPGAASMIVEAMSTGTN